ncbi:MAG: hypothetical protein Ct9H90mP16_14070 [Candidatus Poseidoniales archaeon]|nr:MAG: hypothetical protein Ct9H90mP16_14070 [Candidatus Poseidoniales archaeon]
MVMIAPKGPGTSTEGNVYGCTDTDGDGWADSIDIFPQMMEPNGRIPMGMDTVTITPTRM